MDLGLKGKVAMVAGASRGLGYAVAEALAQEGAHLLQRDVAMADPGQLLEREPLVDEQADLFEIRLAHVLPQGLAHRVGTRLGDGGEDEAVFVGNDHAVPTAIGIGRSYGPRPFACVR